MQDRALTLLLCQGCDWESEQMELLLCARVGSPQITLALETFNHSVNPAVSSL